MRSALLVACSSEGSVPLRADLIAYLEDNKYMVLSKFSR
jgi:hypothetical protein